MVSLTLSPVNCFKEKQPYGFRLLMTNGEEPISNGGVDALMLLLRTRSIVVTFSQACGKMAARTHARLRLKGPLMHSSQTRMTDGSTTLMPDGAGSLLSGRPGGKPVNASNLIGGARSTHSSATALHDPFMTAVKPAEFYVREHVGESFSLKGNSERAIPR